MVGPEPGSQIFAVGDGEIDYCPQIVGRAAAPNQCESASELPVSQQEKSGRRSAMRRCIRLANYCRGDRVLGLGAARCGPGRLTATAAD